MNKCTNLICAYGQSGSGKTTLIEDLAVRVYEKTGKITRLASRSGGGWEPIQPAVDAGIVIPLDLTARSNRFETINKLTRGWWPLEEDGPLVPPPGQFPQMKEHQSEEDWNRVGAQAFDGITEMAEWILHELRDIAVEKKFKFWGNDDIHFVQNDMVISSSAGGMYGMIQEYMAQFVAQTKQLKGWTVLWTALDDKGVDEDTRITVFGPEIIGKKKTAKCPAWFENVLHLQRIDGIYRLWFEEHRDENSRIPYMAKNTANRTVKLRDLNKKLPYLDGENLLGRFLDLLDESRAKKVELLSHATKRRGKEAA